MSQGVSRRRFLGVSIAGGIGMSVAGCLGNGEETDEEVETEVVDEEVFSAPFRTDGLGNDGTWTRIEIANNSTVAHGKLEIQTEFFAEGGSMLGFENRSTDYLPANTTWRYYLRKEYETEDVYELRHSRYTEHGRPQGSPLEDAQIVDSSMEVEDDIVDISGEVAFDEDSPDRIAVVALVYDESDRFLGTTSDVIDNPGETVSFSGDTRDLITPHGEDDPDAYEIRVFDEQP